MGRVSAARDGSLLGTVHKLPEAHGIVGNSLQTLRSVHVLELAEEITKYGGIRDL